VIARLIWGLLRSRLENRSLLPRDLWKLKGAVVGGTDTSIYRPKLAEYWGVEVHESYGCTEAGYIATQAWDRRGMYFFPDVAFCEFIPEDEWERSRQDETYIPSTVLLDEIQPGRPYEVVVTNLHGGPFLRYRLHDLIVFSDPEDREPSIHLPSFYFKSRSADLIDLAGFTGLIDERSMWQVLNTTGLAIEEWSARKEIMDGRPMLHLYIELKEPAEAEDVRNRVDETLRASNPFYADIHQILGYDPLRITLLSKGTFRKFMQMQQEAGADLSHFKPPHMNASDAVIRQLLLAADSQING
jgi:phenylacetate-coenzyme A ligase PaaK-like adenylate-forming protein